MTANERGSSFETKRAMFWAALAAQYADERYVTMGRVVASLFRTSSIKGFCSRAHIDSARVLEPFEDQQALSFEECERRVMDDLARDGIQLGSKEHLARVDRRPFEPVVLGVVSNILEQHGHMGVSPLELLLDLIRADPALAARLAPHGLNPEVIGAAFEKR